jgi:hypothetical protein
MRPESPDNHTANLIVAFPGGQPPTWSAARDLLARRGFPLKVRMIDGQPAFPDEQPPDDWREIRVAAADGMVTIRRDGDRLAFVVWSNAGAELRKVLNAVAWAFAATGSGRIDALQGALDAAAFLRTAELPDGLRGGAG